MKTERLVAIAILLLSAAACDSKSEPGPAATATSAPAASAAAAKTPPEAPPTEKMNPDAIPDAPVRGALKGKPLDGKLYVSYHRDNGTLYVQFSDGTVPHPCYNPEGGSLIKFEIAQNLYAVGKASSAAYGSSDPSIGLKKAYVGFGTDASFSNPEFSSVGYAIRVDKLDPPAKGSEAPGSIKLHIAVLTRMDRNAEKDTPTWFTGTYEGPVCGI